MEDPEAKPRGKAPRQGPEVKPRGKAPWRIFKQQRLKAQNDQTSEVGAECDAFQKLLIGYEPTPPCAPP